jgi:hypothetical protein
MYREAAADEISKFQQDFLNSEYFNNLLDHCCTVYEERSSMQIDLVHTPPASPVAKTPCSAQGRKRASQKARKQATAEEAHLSVLLPSLKINEMSVEPKANFTDVLEILFAVVAVYMLCWIPKGQLSKIVEAVQHMVNDAPQKLPIVCFLLYLIWDLCDKKDVFNTLEC